MCFLWVEFWLLDSGSFLVRHYKGIAISYLNGVRHEPENRCLYIDSVEDDCKMNYFGEKGHWFILLFLLFTGPCDKVKCEYNARCQVKQDQTTECVCPDCDSESEVNAVCGSDGRTYASYCHLKSTVCRTKTVVSLVSKKACGREILNLFRFVCG